MNTSCCQALLHTLTLNFDFKRIIYFTLNLFGPNKVRKSECLKLGSKGEKYAVFVLGYPNYAPRKKIPSKMHLWMVAILGGPWGGRMV